MFRAFSDWGVWLTRQGGSRATVTVIDSASGPKGYHHYYDVIFSVTSSHTATFLVKLLHAKLNFHNLLSSYKVAILIFVFF